MIRFFSSLCLVGLCCSVGWAQDHNALHKRIVVVDGHNDVIIESILLGRDIGQRLQEGHTDIPRLIEGGVDVQVFAVWSDDKRWQKGAFQHANDQIDALSEVIRRNPDQIALAQSAQDISRIHDQGKVAALIGIEGGNMIESSLTNLEALYRRGARYLTLTWNYNLSWATAAAIEDHKIASKQRGLSKKGRAIIRKMNELGMMVDLSHGSKKLFYDVLEVSTKPILVSHSNAATLTPHFRNLDDQQLAALKKNGGVIGINFYSGFLDSDYEAKVKGLYAKYVGVAPQGMSVSKQYSLLTKEQKYQANAPLSLLVDHIEYLVKQVGIDHVAIGSDFDGIEAPPQDLEDVSQFPNLTKALLARGYKEDAIAKIMGLNFLRILKENESDGVN
ncbi:membrane dipeptidase [Sphingobacterium nematocida]|uniref:Membrane dipeptidase n=1 Tax=Sphingobacterium nematocida TaxID=1513896 RepID=A0A1T5G879_9SPHI|nr:dipeptidase [Sphingobacterium nematocida]SKC04595.1 membrane dipeptidase [Sphingobacterium nematocida]